MQSPSLNLLCLYKSMIPYYVYNINRKLETTIIFFCI